MFTVSFKPELLVMDFCSHIMMSEIPWSLLACFYFVRTFRALKHLQLLLHTWSTGTGALPVQGEQELGFK